MNSVTYSNARQNLASLMNEVCSNHDSCVITRKRDQSVVLMSLDDYEEKTWRRRLTFYDLLQMQGGY